MAATPGQHAGKDDLYFFFRGGRSEVGQMLFGSKLLRNGDALNTFGEEVASGFQKSRAE